MTKGAQAQGQIASKRADIGALAHLGLEFGMVRVGERNKAKAFDLNGPGIQLHGLAAAGQVIGALACYLERGIGGRSLTDLAGEGGESRQDFGTAGSAVRRGGDRALGIIGRARLAPPHGEAIGLAGSHGPGDRLRRLAERHRQNAARERIEGAAVAGFLGIEEATHDRHR